jgi:hypothetical protein
MMQAHIVGVLQRMDFKDKSIKNYAIVELGSVQQQFELPFNEFNALVRENMSEESEVQAPAATESVVPEEPVPQEEPAYWGQLPDKVLPERFKAAMRSLDLPSLMLPSDIQRVVENIMAEFTEQDWLEVAEIEKAKQQNAVPPPQPSLASGTAGLATPPEVVPPPQPPPIGQVVWNDGSPVLPAQSRRARTVQKDEMGYPIVSNSDIDPGEVIGSGDDIDEDGIGQM